MKNLLLVLSLVITASPAFASRARLESLGENANGSYYINDGRNIFLNPAAVNMYKKKLFLELGNSDAVADSNAAPKAQGGFLNTFGDFVYGLYVGRESNRALNAVAAANASGAIPGATLIAPDHAFDFFFGGEASSLKYGVDVFYAGAFNRAVAAGSGASTEQTASLFGVKLGVDMNNFAVFTTVGITSSSKVDTHVPANLGELKGKVSVDAGVTYTMDEMTYLAKFTTFGSDLTVGSVSPAIGTLAGRTTAAGLGAGWKKEASKAVTMYSRVQVDYQKDTTETTATVGAVTTTATQTWWNVPVVLAAEAQATSWLTVRGSVSHSLWAQHVTGLSKDSMNNMTTVAMGLGFNFGDLTIDAMAGQAAAVSANGASEASMNGVASGPKFGFGDNMVTRLGMTYNF